MVIWFKTLLFIPRLLFLGVAIKLVDNEVVELAGAAGDGAKGAETPGTPEGPETPEATEVPEVPEAMGVGGEIEVEEGEADVALEIPPVPPLVKVVLFLKKKTSFLK